MFNKSLEEGRAGDNAGILLRGLKKEDVERGQVVAAPGTITPHSEFEAEVYVLSKEEGGRHTPFSTGYKPQFYIRTADVTGEVILPEGTEMVMPGDTVTFNYTLWLSNDEGQYVEKLQHGTMEDITIEDNAKDTGLIWGVWYNLQGMYLNVSKDVYLPACIDDGQERPEGVTLYEGAVANDGWDDRYPIGDVHAQSYGYDNSIESETSGSTYNLRFTALWFRLEVISITKGS